MLTISSNLSSIFSSQGYVSACADILHKSGNLTIHDVIHNIHCFGVHALHFEIISQRIPVAVYVKLVSLLCSVQPPHNVHDCRRREPVYHVRWMYNSLMSSCTSPLSPSRTQFVPEHLRGPSLSSRLLSTRYTNSLNISDRAAVLFRDRLGQFSSPPAQVAMFSNSLAFGCCSWLLTLWLQMRNMVQLIGAILAAAIAAIAAAAVLSGVATFAASLATCLPPSKQGYCSAVWHVSKFERAHTSRERTTANVLRTWKLGSDTCNVANCCLS